MRILSIGLTYSSAPLAFRERLAITGYELDAAHALLGARVGTALILSTCNRTEIYTVAHHPASAIETLSAFLSEWGRLALARVRDVATCRDHEQAVRHLLRVTSGLESMVLGEDQIQAQVKRALAVARRAGTLGPTLERLGSTALACGKRVRAFTGVGRHAVSLESLAVRAAAERAGPLDTSTVVIIGAGESATIVARQLKKAGTRRLTIVSRSAERAAALALAIDARPADVAELSEALCSADVVFGCTSASHPVITRDVLARRAAMRPAAPLLCVDLGMPRDVEPSVAAVPGTSIVTLDELAALADAHREARRADLPAAEAIVNAEAARFLRWLAARDVVALTPSALSESKALG